MPAWSIPLPLTWSSSSADSSLRLVSESVSLPGRSYRRRSDAIVSRMGGLPDIAAVLTTIWVAGAMIRRCSPHRRAVATSNTRGSIGAGVVGSLAGSR